MAVTKRAPCSQQSVLCHTHTALKTTRRLPTMIKYWQSMHDYLHFLNESKVHFDSSERTRLHTELWKPWQKLRSFDTDRAMVFLLPFYSSTGRPARNQPQIFRSFILFSSFIQKGWPLPPLPYGWTGSGQHLNLTATPATDSFLPPGTAESQKNRKAKSRKHRKTGPKLQSPLQIA